nr:glycine dehydrogenase [Solirubrobacterales bacterium]
VREFAICFDAPVEGVVELCAERGIAAGVPLGPEYGNGLLVALTERRTKEDIDRLAETIEAALAETPRGTVAETGRSEAGVA